MQFRLTYDGTLPAAAPNRSRTDEKHVIRCHLHPQLRELIRTHQTLKGRLGPDPSIPLDHPKNRPYVEKIGDQFARCGYRFVPLIGPSVRFFGEVEACGLDILFLRRDAPGNVIRHGGDIDNRLKVLFDALRVPADCSEVPKGAIPTADEDPLYCLLQNDSLITNVSVTTDRLLTPLGSEHIHDVRLIMHVKTLALGDDL